jgi:hypothetical protein
VSHEAVVQNPEAEIGRLCEFLDIVPSPAMLDPDSYHDHHSGTVWIANSNLHKLSGFDRRALSSWRDTLPSDVQAMTELVCGAEMPLAGYQCDRGPYSKALQNEALDYMVSSVDEPCSWRSDLRDGRQDHANEVGRLDLLKSSSDDTNVIRRNFLFEPVYRMLQAPMACCVTAPAASL